MNTKNLLCLVSTFALAAGTMAQAQSLPEVAKAEKARREKIRATGGASKLYTEGDRTGTAAEAGTETPQGDGAIAAGAASSAPKKKEEPAADPQKVWSDKVKAAQDEIKALQEEIGRNERVLASMINITPARADLATRLEADKKKLANLNQKLADLEEERRRAGLARPR